MLKRFFWGVLFLGLSASLVYGDLVAYWPFDEFPNEETTPDVVNGYDLEVYLAGPDSYFDATNHVDGKSGKAFEFIASDTTLLARISDEGDLLPINQYPAFTISFWTQTFGQGQNDLRLISEASTSSNSPLFNIGTANNGNDDTLDIYIRNTAGNATGHLRTTATPFDGEWHHIGWTFQDGAHSIFIDGEFDRTVDWPSLAGDDPFVIDTTTVGGILRAVPSHFVSGVIDEVAMWNEVLSVPSIVGLASETKTPLTALDILKGDFNDDGKIDDTDYNTLVTHFRDAGSYADGDVNGDGVIDLVDFGEFLASADAVGAVVPRTLTVPEPTGLASLLLVMVFGLLQRRPRARR